MTLYRVVWRVEVEADNARQAARRAWAIQRGRTKANRTRDGREAAVFYVAEPGGGPAIVVDFRDEPVARRRMVRDLPKTVTRYGIDKETGMVLAPRTLDMIARELIDLRKRNMSPVVRDALQGLLGRPAIAEAMYPDLAIRAARIVLEVLATWEHTQVPRIRAELLDQIEEYERFRAELNRGEKP